MAATVLSVLLLGFTRVQAVPGLSSLTGGIHTLQPLVENQLLEGLSASSDETSPRKLEMGPNFRAKYKTRFQHLVDGGCSGSKPALQVFCTGDISVLSTSDPSIECTALPPDVEDVWKGYECINTCSDESCKDIYLEGDRWEDGVFGEIVFQCEGDSVFNITAGVVYLAGSGGNCTGEDPLEGRNYHVLQVGVYCEDLADFYFDDYIFECFNGFSTTGKDFMYSCLGGSDCGGQPCEVEFNHVILDTDLIRLLELPQCIEKRNDVLFPVLLGLFEPRPGLYKSRFQAGWELHSTSGSCGESVPPKMIVKCTIGEISLVETTYSTVSCQRIGKSELECTETGGSNYFRTTYEDYTPSGCTFECTATDRLPQASVLYQESTQSCSTAGETFWHSAQLGAYCETLIDGGVFHYSDDFAECSYASHGFERHKVDGFERATCIAGVAADAAGVPVAVPPVSIETDRFSWQRYAQQNSCYTLEETAALITPSPAVQLTSEPTMQEAVNNIFPNNPTSVPAVPRQPTLIVAPVAPQSHASTRACAVLTVIGAVSLILGLS